MKGQKISPPFYLNVHILEGARLHFTVMPLAHSQRIWGHFLFVIADAIILNGPAANNPGSPFLICYASVTSSLFLWDSQRTKHKASRHLSALHLKHVYLQIMGELGKRPQRKAAWRSSESELWSLSAPSEAALLLPSLIASRATRRASKSSAAAGDVWLLTGS